MAATTSDREILGRYVTLSLNGRSCRVYYESAGSGIPLICQHTAGTDGRQWRKLLEDDAVTSRFRVVVPDLPYHGKSLPPEGEPWWAEQYKLTTKYFEDFIVAIVDALDLGEPVYIGCSMGGHLAGDLAVDHPDRFRAVIGVEGAMECHGPEDGLATHFHPRVSKEFTAAMMYGLCSPTSPEAGKRETQWLYAQAGPFVHRGDLNYYVVDHDLTASASSIDTSRIPVYLMSGEYDWSARPEDVKRLADAINGSVLVSMPGIGHFPMSEDYPRFREHLLPVLDEIAARD
jgi:pimeloyl-ACP methyl ester carboxylesterase